MSKRGRNKSTWARRVLRSARKRARTVWKNVVPITRDHVLPFARKNVLPIARDYLLPFALEIIKQKHMPAAYKPMLTDANVGLDNLG